MLKRSFWLGKTSIILLICLTVIIGIVIKEAFAKEKKNITIILWHKHTRAEDGFKSAVEKTYDVNWTEVCAEQKKEKLEEILKGIVPKKTDLIYTYGTTVSGMAKQAIKDIPIVFNIITDPIGAKVINSWEHSGGNIVGGSIKISAETRVKTLKMIKDFKKAGLIYNPDEMNSVLDMQEFQAVKDKLGYTVVLAPFSAPEKLNETMRILDEAKIEAVIFASCSMCLANAEALTNALIERKLPVVSHSTEVARMGALVAVGPDYYRLGERVGEIAIRVLKGEKPNDIPSITADKFDIVFNLKTANKMGIKIPAEVMKTATEIIQ